MRSLLMVTFLVLASLSVQASDYGRLAWSCTYASEGNELQYEVELYEKTPEVFLSVREFLHERPGLFEEYIPGKYLPSPRGLAGGGLKYEAGNYRLVVNTTASPVRKNGKIYKRGRLYTDLNDPDYYRLLCE